MTNEHAIHRVGRKKLFWAGGVQMILAQIAATILMAVTFKHVSPPIYSIVLIEVFVCMFTAGFAYSWGPLGWLVRPSSLPITGTIFAACLGRGKIDSGLCLICAVALHRYLLRYIPSRQDLWGNQ